MDEICRWELARVTVERGLFKHERGFKKVGLVDKPCPVFHTRVSHPSPTNFSQTIKTRSGREQERTAISAVRRPWMLAYGFVTVGPMMPSNWVSLNRQNQPFVEKPN
ncbi:predicted protein [Histoplasma capsulatum H143]|uniref:Uncharacterized protein n=1 Tax=Ajellomyces capsulatus (strain H143) TaxID=544712 RepID=C6HD00_AJECH|nr:predicted protein [Histoplasma capsulatum H143]